MKNQIKKAKRHKMSHQQRVTTLKAVKNYDLANKRLKVIGFNKDEISTLESGNLPAIVKMYIERNRVGIDNIRVYETDEAVFPLKPYGDWKCTDFILALEDFQQDIPNGKYTTIQQCMENRYFQDCDAEDQSQLIDIANWYLYDTEQSKENS